MINEILSHHYVTAADSFRLLGRCKPWRVAVILGMPGCGKTYFAETLCREGNERPNTTVYPTILNEPMDGTLSAESVESMLAKSNIVSSIIIVTQSIKKVPLFATKLIYDNEGIVLIGNTWPNEAVEISSRFNICETAIKCLEKYRFITTAEIQSHGLRDALDLNLAKLRFGMSLPKHSCRSLANTAN